jgi:hypothetical protein
MRKSVLGIVCFGLLVSGWTPPPDAAGQPADEKADAVLAGGKILSVDPENRIHQALAIRDGRIVAVGSDDEIAGWVGDRTSVVRLEGRTVIPGVTEAHVHAIGAARLSLEQPYVELSSIGEVQDWIRRRVLQVPPGTWIQVPRTDVTRLAERRHPTPAELDAASTTHPVAFNAARKWALNTLGFETVGISKEKREIPGGQVIVDKRGNPRLIAGGDAHLHSFLAQPEHSDEELLDALARLMHVYNQVGITSIGERATDRAGYDFYRKLHERGDRTVRVTATFRRQMTNREDVERFVKDLGLQPGEGDEWLRAGPLKITLDGGIHWGNAYLSEAYGESRAKFYVLDDPLYRGEVRYTVQQMRDVFAAGHRLGWQMCVHVTGDAGVDLVLDALEAANREVPLADRRFTLLHCYFPSIDSIARARRLGVCAETHPILYLKDADAIAEVFGESWAERFIGLGDWVRGGIPTAINSDHMIGLDPDHAMNSFNPFLQMHVAVNRKSQSGRTYGPHQKLSRVDALRAATIVPAYLNFNERDTGSLEAGKLADLAVLDRDYLECPAEEIREIKVLMTMAGGDIVYHRKQDSFNILQDQQEPPRCYPTNRARRSPTSIRRPATTMSSIRKPAC